MKKILLIGLIATLSGCGGPEFLDSNRQDVYIEGHKIAVIPVKDYYVSWYRGNDLILLDRSIPPLHILKPLQIKAIEAVTKCTVTSSEYDTRQLSASYLTANVDCSKK